MSCDRMAQMARRIEILPKADQAIRFLELERWITKARSTWAEAKVRSSFDRYVDCKMINRTPPLAYG